MKTAGYYNHPQAALMRNEGERCPTLSRYNGTGGGNTPLVLLYENHAQDSRTRIVASCPTLGATNGDCVRGGQTLVLNMWKETNECK